jgi:hypothetical protein
MCVWCDYPIFSGEFAQYRAYISLNEVMAGWTHRLCHEASKQNPGVHQFSRGEQIMMHREDFQQGYLDFLAEVEGRSRENYVPLSSDAAWEYECGRKSAMAKTIQDPTCRPL